MGKILVLHPSRGTKLYRNTNSELSIEIGTKEYIPQIEILLLQGEDVSIQKLDIRNNRILILPNQGFLCVNLSNVPITLKFGRDPKNLKILFPKITKIYWRNTIKNVLLTKF